MHAVTPLLGRVRALRWATFLIAFVLLVSPMPAFAAPALQDVDPDLIGTWQSVPSQADETITISLFADGALSATSTYEGQDEVSVYGGSWESTGEETFTLYIEVVDGEAVPDPIEFVGLVTRRGLRLPDAPDWGRNGMSLTLLDENPTDFSAEAVVEEDATDDTTDESTGDETGLAGVYATEEIVDDDGGVTVITITLYDDGAMETTSSYESDTQNDSSFETGTWLAEDDGSITITYETVNGEEYDPPVSLIFLINGDSLQSPDLAAFGPDGLVVWRVADLDSDGGEPEVIETDEGSETDEDTDVDEPVSSEGSSIAGVYTGELADTSGTPAGVLIYLDDAGYAQSLVIGFTGDDLAISRTGEWVDNGDGTISVTFNAQLLFDSLKESVDIIDLDSPETVDFEIAEGALLNPEVSLYKAGAEVMLAEDDLSVGEEGLAEEVLSEEMNADEILEEETLVESPDTITFISPMDTILNGTTATLVMLEDGSASLAIVSRDLASTLIQVGTWEIDEEAYTITISLAVDGFGKPLDTPASIVFHFDEDAGTLTPESYDASIYGPDLLLEMTGE